MRSPSAIMWLQRAIIVMRGLDLRNPVRAKFMRAFVFARQIKNLKPNQRGWTRRRTWVDNICFRLFENAVAVAKELYLVKVGLEAASSSSRTGHADM